MTGTLYCKKHRPSDEMLNRGPDSLWSLKIPGLSFEKELDPVLEYVRILHSVFFLIDPALKIACADTGLRCRSLRQQRVASNEVSLQS